MTAECTSQSRLYTRQDMTGHELVETKLGQVAVLTMRAPGKETDNEDAVAIIAIDERRLVLAVADGLGGHAGGADASWLTLDILTERLEQLRGTDEPVQPAVLAAVDEANQRVLSLGIGAGTTLAVIEIEDRAIRPYHVGDSVILVLGQRGKIKSQTVPHSPVGYAVEAGLIDEAEAIHHRDRHIVSNIVGSPTMRIEIGPATVLRPRDTIVLASDGLFDNLHLDEIVQRVRKGGMEQAADALRITSRHRMIHADPSFPSKPDDLSYLVFRPRTD